jgi:hypothetical protein
MRIVPAHGRAAALGLALLALLGAAAGLWSARDRAWDAVAGHPYFVVRQISVRGAERYLSETAVLDWLAVAPGDSLWSVSPARARRRLESHPFVASASVRREFPDRLHIELRERRPRAIVLLDRLYYLDRAGTVFGPLEADPRRAAERLSCAGSRAWRACARGGRASAASPSFISIRCAASSCTRPRRASPSSSAGGAGGRRSNGPSAPWRPGRRARKESPLWTRASAIRSS